KVKNFSPSEIDDDIFIIANHFNKGRQFVKEQPDIDQLVDINLRAGKKAKEATAYDAAIEYFSLGKQFLNFDDHYAQLADFYLQGATSEYLAGQYDKAEKDLDELFSNCKARIDKLEVLMIKVYMYTTKDEKEKAVEAGRTGFRLYGLIMPRSLPVIMMVLLKDIIKARWTLRGKKMDHAPERPVMKDHEQIRFLEFTLAVSPPIYQYDQNLFAWDVMKMVSYSLRYGNNGVASFGYMGFGMILAQMMGLYKTGKKLADIGLTINKQLGYTVLKWKLHMSYHNFVQHWTRPVRPEFDNMQEIISGCIANGDPIYAGYGIFHYHQKKFALGFPLPSVQQSYENYLQLVDQRGDRETRHFLEGYYHAVRCLRGEDDNELLMGNDFNAPERLQQIVASSSFSIAADTYIAYMNILYQFQHNAAAWQRYLESGKYVNFIYHRYEYAEYTFYGGLICARAYEQKLSPQKPYLKLLKGHLKKIKNWCSNCPDNFEPQYFLLQAELARVTGKKNDAATLYENAIRSAEKYLFINYKALASELAGRFYFSSGNSTVAKTYLDNARRSFLQWGAVQKVKFLEKEFQSLLGASILEDKKPGAESISMENVDVNLLLQASRTISSVKDVDQVIEQLMLTVIRNSGADTGYLLIRNRADLVVKASYKVSEGVRSITEYIDPETLPLNTIRYVARLKDPLTLNNPARLNEYNTLPYFISHHPQSVLIYPVLKQGELFGILYLENYLSEGVFDTKRVGLLNLISGQIAMLLDNAYLYRNMESMVKERTVELEAEKEQ
ncbi:MAG TPA: GAF domain-containing protein, partial [Chitinophagaceae bacterium]|nr:GAF domain-containing protein [Chitinophagaceae bacterium]